MEKLCVMKALTAKTWVVTANNLSVNYHCPEDEKEFLDYKFIVNIWA